MLRVSHFRWCATTMLCWTRLWLLPGQHIAVLSGQSGSGCCSLWNSTGLGGVACIVHATRPYLDIIPDKYTFSPSPCWDLSGMNDIEQCQVNIQTFCVFLWIFLASNLEWSGTMLPFTDLRLNSDRIMNILDKNAQKLDWPEVKQLELPTAAFGTSSGVLQVSC